MFTLESLRKSTSSIVWRSSCRFLSLFLIIGLIPTARSAECRTPRGLVGWWAGDGNARDLAGALHGALAGDASFEVGRVAQSFRFAGGGFAEVADAPGFAFGTGDFSIEFWVLFNRLEHNAAGVLSKDSFTGNFGSATGWVINACDSCGDGTFGVGGGGFGIETRDLGGGGGHAHARWPLSNLSTGTWYHIAAVRRASVLNLYVNGVLRASTPEPTPVNVTTSAPLTLGTLNPIHTQGMDGRLDEVAIYGRALGEWEIAEIVAAGSAGRCKDFPGADSPSNLVINGTFEAGNSGFGSDYVADSSGTLPETAYAVVSAPVAARDGYFPATDHTSGVGRMLVVNGAVTAGKAFWRQTVAVAPNTTYRFSAWAANLVEFSPPKLELYVNGVRLGGEHPLPSTPLGQWRDVVEFWSSGSSTTAVLELRDAEMSVGGNDFAVDDITFSANLPGVTAISADVTANVGETVAFSVTPFGAAPLSFQWLKDGLEVAGATEATLTLNNLQTPATGNYSVVIRNALGSYTSAAIALRFTAGSAVTFADANLETAVRNALGKPTGPLTVGDLESLTSLSARAMGIRFLGGLEAAVNLTALDVNDHSIQDLTPVAALTALQSLNLENGSEAHPLTDLRPLAQLHQLTVLYFSNNSVTDLTPLAALTKLRGLGMSSRNRPVSFTPLAGLTQLGYLNVGETGLRDLSFISGLSSLDNLQIYVNPIRSIAPLVGCSNLVYLNLSSTLVQDWTGLSAVHFPRLQSLDAQQTSMFDLEWVRRLPQLTRLNVSWNRIRDVTPITTQTHVKSLDIRGNPVTDISPLADLPPLDALGVSNMMLDVSSGSAADAVIQHLTSTGGSVDKQDQVNPPEGILRVSNQSVFGGDWFDLRFSAAPVSEGGDVASVTAHSSNQAVLADSELLVRGLGASWGVRASTRAGVQGITTVTLTTHRRSGATQQASFEVQVIDRRAGTVYIEAEDYDFDHGKILAAGSIGMSGPYAGDAFRGLGSAADKGIDWDDNGPANSNNRYRTGPASEIVAYPFDAFPEFISRGTFDVAVNYVLRWTENGRWQNYTRTFPAGYYHVFAAQTLLGDSSQAKLEEVVGGVGSIDQRTRALGKFDWYGGAPSWDALVQVPLKDPSGAWARVYLSGKRTLRYTDAWPAVDYLSFVPAPTSDPAIEAQPPDILATIGGSATIAATPVGTGPFTFQWRKNGVDIPGKTSATLTLENLQLGATGDYTVEVRNALGSYVSPRIEVSFDPATSVSISDPRLETAVRDTLGKPTGGLTVGDMERLSRLDLGGRGVLNLSGLETARYLAWLNLSVDGGLPANAPERALNMGALAQLGRLEYLNLSGLALRSIEVLRSLSMLTELQMPNWWNVVDIQDYSPLDALKQLRTLDLGAHKLGTLETIRDLQELRNLGLNHGVVTNIAAVAGFTKLETFAVANSDLTTIEGLRGLKQLWLLDLGIFYKPSAVGLNELTNVLGSLTNLSWLSIAGRPVTSASQIAPTLRSMPRLSNLTLDFTPLEDGAALAEFTGLAALQLSNTRLTSLAFLKPLIQLRTVSLQNGTRTMRIPRTEWDVLPQLLELRELDVRYQSVRDLDFLQGMNRLERLNIGDLQVTDLAPIRALPNLYWLFAEGGVLSEISDVETLPQLREFFVNNNYLDPVDGSADRQLIARLQARGVAVYSFFPQRSELPVALSIGEVSVLSGSTVFRTFLAADRARVGSLTSITATSDNPSVVRSSDITVRGRGPVRSVEIPTLANGEGTASITLTSAYSDATTITANSRIQTLRAGAGSVFIEAEDFDFDHGHWVQDQPIGVGGPYFGGSYQGRGTQADQGYDLNMRFQDRFSQYRPGVSAATLDTNFSQDPETNTRGTFDVVVNHVLAWQDQGNWYQYTRDFPAGFYHAYARTSLESMTEHFSLSQVTAGAGTRDAALKPLGTFDRVVSTTSQRYHFVPMRDRYSGALETIYLSGVSTLRLESDGNTAPWVDYMVLVPAAQTDPGIFAQPSDVVGRVGDTIRLAVTPVGSGPFAFQWRKNGRDLPGATGAELVLPNAALPLTGLFQVVIQGANGTYETQEIHVGFDPTSTVLIPDTKLEAAVRNALGKPSGGLTVGDMQRLTQLDLANVGVLSLAGLETAENLTWLNLEVNGGLPVGAPERQLDVSVLGQFTRMGWMNLTGLGLRSIEFLRSMPGLTDLVFNNWSGAAAVTDFSPLSALRSLRSLGMEAHRIPSLAPLRGLPALFSLGLNWCDIGDATDLAGIPSLQNLSLFNVSFPSARFLAGMTQLVNLNIGIVIGGNSLVSVADLQQSLGGLVNLEGLDVSGRPFRRSADLVGLLSYLPRLRSLWVNGCPLEEGSGLAAFPQLTQLALSDTFLTHIQFLASLPNLQSLWLRDNNRRLRIPEAQWDVLRSLTKLQSLDLAGNRIGRLSFLDSCVALRELNIEGSRVTDLGPLASLPQLQNIGAGGSLLADLTPALAFPSLRNLWADNAPLLPPSALGGRDVVAELRAKGVNVSANTQLIELPALSTAGMRTTSDGLVRGFTGVIHQADNGTTDNTLLRAEQQLAGVFGVSAQAAPFFENSALNYDNDEGDQGRFGDNFNFPNLRGFGRDRLALSATGYVQLKAGWYVMGVNSDDGFAVSSGFAPLYRPAAGSGVWERDTAVTVLGSFDGGRGAADTTFLVHAPEDGFYPLRLLWEEGGGGANLEWWIVDLQRPAGEREVTLVNDLSKPNAVAAFTAPPAANTPPVVTLESSLSILAGTPLPQRVRLHVTDSETPIREIFGSMAIQVTSRNLAAVPADALRLVREPAALWLEILPDRTAGGMAVVEIQATDAGGLSGVGRLEVRVVDPANAVGYLRREIYSGIANGNLSSLRDDPRFPSDPSRSELVESAESPSLGDNYGQRISAYLMPPVTGDYVFYIASDDQGELWLSTDASRAHVRPIANEPVWNSFRAYQTTDRRNPAAPENRSVPIRLEAGKAYYFEALMAEGGGGDNLSIAWQMPGGTPPADGSEPIPGRYFSVTPPTSQQLAQVLANGAGQRTVNPSNGHVYYLLPPSSWQEAEAAAQALGGHLASINDASEQDWVFSTFGGSSAGARSLWIGLHKADDLSLSWTTGEPVNFTHWFQGSAADNFVPEPNGGTTEPYVHMIREGYHPRVPAGTWNDLASPNVNWPAFEPIQGVVELNYDPQLPNPGVLIPPQDVTVAAGGTAVFTVTPNGTGPFTYEWQREGVKLAGQSGPSMTLNGVRMGDVGQYTVLVRNALGSVVSAAARLAVTPSGIVGAHELSLVGRAQIAGSTLRLTPSEPALRGAAWLRRRQSVTGGFETIFQFQLSSPVGVAADGFAFVVQADGLDAIGGTHASLGYEGIKRALVVAFDTYGNGAPVDSGSPNISIQVGGADLPHSLANTGTGLGSSLSVGQVHTARIRYEAGALAVYLDDLQHPAVSVAVDLSAIIATNDGEAYVGFTASTGGGAETHDILAWEFRSLPLDGAPRFTAQPPSLIAPFLGQDVSLAAETSDFPNADTFQWFYNGAPLSDSGRIIGSSSRRLTLRGLTVDDGGSYTVKATRGGLVVESPATLLTTHPIPAPEGLGRVLMETYSNLDGDSINDLKAWRGFPTHPDQLRFVSAFEASPAGSRDGRRLTALIWPPITGDYRFFLAAQGGAELRLSSDGTAANATLIAREPIGSDPRSYQGAKNRNAAAPENRSGVIHLEAGRGYFLEAIVKEGFGVNHLSVAWQLPGGAAPANGDEPISGVFLSSSIPANFSKLDPAHRVIPDLSKPGFVASVHQVGGPMQPNTLDRAERQLLGLLTDAGGQPLPNVADLSRANLGSRFGISGSLDLNAFSDGGRGRFTQDVQMPGLPGTTGVSDNVAMEILTYLELPQGFVRMGVNSDDGFETSAGMVGDALQRRVLGSFDGGRGFADSIFEFYVPEAGVYPFRTVWEQGGGGAGIEWFTETADGRAVLVNDVANGGVRAFQVAANVPVNETPVLLTQPRAGARNVILMPKISALIDDPLGKVDVNAFLVMVREFPVFPSIERSGGQVRISWTPTTPFPSGVEIPVTVSYKTTSGVVRDFGWRFSTTEFPVDAKFIEVEDFDYGHGQWVTQKPIGMTGPYAGGAYAGLGTGLNGTSGDGSDYGVDYLDFSNANDQPVYRPGTAVEAGKLNQHADGLIRSTFEVQANYVVGWNGSGEWFNYTRAFPEYGQRYRVLARMASGGEPMAANLSRVTSGVGTIDQTTELLGDFRTTTSTGGWDVFTFVELKNAAGASVTPLLHGTNTLRLTVLPGNADLDYLAFIPIPGTEVYPPKIVQSPLPRQVFEGGEIRLDVEATGAGPLTYEWRRGTTVLPNVTGPSLVVLKATAQDAGSYTVRVSNEIGVAVSTPATITVETPTISPVQIRADAVSGGPGAKAILPVRVRGFNGVGGLQFSVTWDPVVARLDSVTSFGLNGLTEGSFNLTQSLQGVVSLSWDDLQGGGVFLADDKLLFNLNFTLVGSVGTSTPVRIVGAPTVIEVVDAKPNALPYLMTDGSLAVVPSVNLGGKVRFYSNQALMVPGVQVAVSGGTSRTMATSSTGDFNFSLDTGKDYDLIATKSEEAPASQGVTTLDITLVRRQILGIAPLDSPYKILAADVNRSDSVTTLDITLMRRLILGLTNNLPAGAWRFVPSNVGFANPSAPWGFDAARKHRGLGAESSTEDFIGIRLGDVNGSWTPASTPPPPAPAASASAVQAESAPITVLAPDSGGALPMPPQPSLRARLVVGGLTHTGPGEMELPVTVAGVRHLGTIQFALNWNPEVLEFVRVDGTELPGFDESQMSTAEAGVGVFRLAWNHPQAMNMSLGDPSVSTPVMKLIFKPRTTHPAVSAIRFLRDGPTSVELTADLATLSTDLVEQPVWLGRTPGQAGLGVVKMGSDGGALQVPTWQGARTVVEVIHDLSQGDWQVLGTFEGDGSAVTMPLPASGSAQGYYRLRFEF